MRPLRRRESEMAGWGGVVASGLLGAAAGVGQSGAEDILLKQKEGAVARQQAQLAALQQQSHAANAQLDIDLKNKNAPIETANAVAREEALRPVKVKERGEIAAAEVEARTKEGRVVGGAMLLPDGSWNVPPKKEETPEEKAVRVALVHKYEAEAEAARAHGRSYDAGKPAKDRAPSLVDVGKDQDDVKMMRDKDTGVVIKVEPGKEGSPAVDKAWYESGKSKPAVAASNPKSRYFIDGVEITGNDYKKLRQAKGLSVDDIDGASALSTASAPKSAGVVNEGLPKEQSGPSSVKTPVLAPPGYTFYGTDKKTGRPIYQGADGNKILGK